MRPLMKADMWLVLFLLLLPVQALAGNVIWMSGLDCGDEDTSGYDCFEMVQVLNEGTAEDNDVRIDWTTKHDTSTGGHDSSHAAGYVTVTTGEQAYYRPAEMKKCDDADGALCEDDTDCSGSVSCIGGVGMCASGAETSCTDDSECSDGNCRWAESSPFPLVDTYELTVGGTESLFHSTVCRPVFQHTGMMPPTYSHMH